MIVNVFSVVLLFADAVCLVLAVLLAGAAAWQLRAARRLGRPEVLEGLERGDTLALAAALTLLGLRLLSWPLLYATLQSFVPVIEGAMCIFGVTRGHPALARAVEIAKPVAVFLAGAWLLRARLDRKTASSPLARGNARLLLALSVLMLVEIPLEIALIAGTRATFVVTCCTTVADVADRPTSLVPAALLGPSYAGGLTLAAGAVTAVLAALGFWGGLRAGPSRAPGGRGGTARVAAGAALAALALPLVWLFTIEVLAPAWLGLPQHHCGYCFLAFRDAPLAVAAFLLGTFGFGWAAVLRDAGRGEELGGPARPMARRALFWSACLLLGAWGMAAVHLAAGHAP